MAASQDPKQGQEEGKRAFPEFPGQERLFDLAVPEAGPLGGTDEEPPKHPSMIGHLIKQLSPGADLTRTAIPAWFLEPRSLLEAMADLMMHADLLPLIPAAETPLGRMKAMVRWYISGWHYKRHITKPFNPVVGETFACHWDHDDGSRSQWYAEQVSHRPPVTGIYIENRQAGVSVNAQVHTASKFVFPQTAQSILKGFTHVHLTNLGEVYHCTLPTYNLHNLLAGSMRSELGGTTVITCPQTDMRAVIHFRQKPAIFGYDKINLVDVEVLHAGKQVAKCTGHWDKVMTWQEGRGKAEELFNAQALPIQPKFMLPPELLAPFESRRLWASCAAQLMVRPQPDWEAVEHEKAVLERAQRELPCHAKEEADRRPWATKNFHRRLTTNYETGEKEEWWEFDFLRTTPFAEGEPALNVHALSRTTPDVRYEPAAVPALPGGDADAAATGGAAAAAAGAGGAGEGAAAAPAAAAPAPAGNGDDAKAQA